MTTSTVVKGSVTQAQLAWRARPERLTSPTSHTGHPMLRSFCAVVLSSVLLSGCMFFESSADRQLRHQPNFRVGYEDGCATATNEGANMRHGDTVKDDA